MIKIGMTGGIACGKSQAARYFEERGAPVIDADEVVRELTAPGGPFLEAVVEQAGSDVLESDGILDRTLLRTRLFLDSALRRDLEALLHPPVRAAIRDWFAQQEKPYAIATVPLLIEAGWQDDMDRILVVNCPGNLQRQRLRERFPKMDNKQADAILATQLSADERLRHADDVIENSGSMDALAEAVDELHQKYLAA